MKMKREIEWNTKVEKGVKRIVRVNFIGGGKITWQFKLFTRRNDDCEWDFDSEPTEEDWDTLEEKLTAAVNRRRRPVDDLELVKKLRKQMGV